MTKANSHTEYAYSRSWPFGQLTIGSCTDLQECWSTSRILFVQARAALAALSIDATIVHSLVVAGSLGRMEAQDHSDCDLLIFLQEDISADDPLVKQQVDAIWSCLQKSGMRLPKPWGIFANAIAPSALLRPESLGDLNESREIFGKRIQLLLDCQPLWGDAGFEQLQFSVLQWYATVFVTDGNSSQWRYLLTDLVRYYKSYSAWHQFKLTVEHDDSWLIRDAKLRSSRFIMYAGLVLQLGQQSTQIQDKLEKLHEQLHLTPLERVMEVFKTNDQDASEMIQVLEHYNVYYKIMAKRKNRQCLVDQAPRTIDALGRINSDTYTEIDQACNQLKTALTRFILRTQSRWHPVFLETLFFH